MKDTKSAIRLFIIFTIICGGIYPALVTFIGQTAFPKQANGSLITDRSGKEIGSSLIGQPFTDPKYFWPRPSATSGFSYNPLASGGSNAGPTNPDYLKIVTERVKTLRATGITATLTADMVQASASGLDPHITPESARQQIARVAKTRGISEKHLLKIVTARIEEPRFGFLGAPRVNVLVLNLELDRL